LARITKGRIEKYKRIARDLEAGVLTNAASSRDKAFLAFQERLHHMNVDYTSGNFRTTGMFRAPHSRSIDGIDIACIGLPLDRGVPFDRCGTRQGPQAFRYWSNSEGGFHEVTGFNVFEDCSVCDWGDLAFSKSGFDLTANIEEIASLYHTFYSKGVSTFTVGGEHTCSLGILKGLSGDGERPLSLIQLDAHHDTLGSMNGAEINDGSVFRIATLNGYIDPEKTIQIGVRGRNLMALGFAEAVGIKTISARQFKEMGIEEVAELTRNVVGEGPSYISVCSDVFDASVFPGTTLPSAFGLSPWDVRNLLDRVHQLDFVGADIMEFSPIHDPTATSGALAAALGFELLTMLGQSKKRSGLNGNGLTVWE